ncbi:MAG: FliH/SctL family protein [Burkholderiaceae bacterium]
MTSSSRILAAEEIISFERFALDPLSADDTTPAVRGSQPADSVAGNAAAAAHGDVPGREQDYRDGFRAGQAEALAESQARDRALGATLQQRTEALLQALDAEFNVFQARHADRVVDLAIAIAGQIVRASLQADRALIVPVVHEALGHLHEGSGPATLLLDPLDAVMVGELLAPLLQQRRVTIVADAAVQAGGCRLVSNEAEVDATLATRWQRLLAAMGRTPPPEEAGSP